MVLDPRSVGDHIQVSGCPGMTAWLGNLSAPGTDCKVMGRTEKVSLQPNMSSCPLAEGAEFQNAN